MVLTNLLRFQINQGAVSLQVPQVAGLGSKSYHVNRAALPPHEPSHYVAASLRFEPLLAYAIIVSLSSNLGENTKGVSSLNSLPSTPWEGLGKSVFDESGILDDNVPRLDTGERRMSCGPEVRFSCENYLSFSRHTLHPSSPKEMVLTLSLSQA